eukprot:CAMPEP_0196681254 /NCGR_PEP_ID=MMETSP1090-20130531/8359_1 /TAXON_ID=37098 /ORGANISM="Isochrysis sp, Strain CCMP1244" /LENGTH=195 /DNA_ID=CAMNT_0042019599 /DNA_START=17 /DNA_END=604 /DNA_ORIENTATION=+
MIFDIDGALRQLGSRLRPFNQPACDLFKVLRWLAYLVFCFMLLATLEFLKDCRYSWKDVDRRVRVCAGCILFAPHPPAPQPSPPPNPPSSPPAAPPLTTAESIIECMSSHYSTPSSYFAPLTLIGILVAFLPPFIQGCCEGSSEARSEDGNQEFIDAEGRREAAIIDEEGRREAEDGGERPAAIPATPGIAMSSV